MKKVAVVYGGWSKEAEISRKSGKAVASALRRLGFNVSELELSRDIAQKLLKLSPDFVFPVLHGKPGEDGSFQGLLEILEIPYIGENHKVSSLCMDKDFTKRLLKNYGIDTPKWISIKGKRELFKLEDWQIFPSVVKPAEEGSSIGLKVVYEKDTLTQIVKDLLQITDKVIVEEFISGREFTCGFVSGKVFTPLEIKPKSGIYDFETKYTKGAAEFVPETTPLGGKIKEITLNVVECLEIENLCRVDFRYDSKRKKLLVLEVNTIPGMTETSLLPQMARVDGISFDSLINLIISAKGFGVGISSNLRHDKVC